MKRVVSMLRTFVFTLTLLAGLPPAVAVAGRPAHVVKIYKAERRMVVEVGGKRLRELVIALGGAPKGDKIKRGDQRTPEGRFYVTTKNPRSQFHRFIGLSYPMTRHAENGLEDKRVSKRTLAKIRAAVRDKKNPPQNTALGGWVGIHGGGAGADWTLGCIAVSDEEAEWLFERLRPGDEIYVFP